MSVELLGKFGVGLVIAGKKSDGNGSLAGNRGDLLDPVGPVASTPEQADHDKIGLRHDLLDIKIDREVVAEAEKVGEAQARPAVARCGIRRGKSGPRCGEAGDLGVGRRQHDDLAGALAEIDGGGAVVDTAWPGCEQMHGSAAPNAHRAADHSAASAAVSKPASIACTATLSTPRSAMTTSSLRRVSSARHGRS